MTRDKLRELVENYAHNMAKIAVLKAEVEQLKLERRQIMDSLVDDEVQTTSVLTGMPRGGQTGDPAGRLAVKLASGWLPDRVQDIDAQIKVLKGEIEVRVAEQRFVDGAIKGLDSRDQFVYIRYALRHEMIRDIRMEFKRQYGREYSQRQMIRIIQAAEERFYAVVDE